MILTVNPHKDPKGLPDGDYLITDKHPQILSVAAMEISGEAVVHAEHFNKGVRHVYFRLGEGNEMRRRNPEGDEEAHTSMLPPRFFADESAKKYQERWNTAWWREAFQNAVDAHAKHITCTVEKNPDGTYWTTCEDDGDGMTKEVLRDKFLEMMGSTKQLSTSTAGGFGTAKQLLIFPWMQYKIETQTAGTPAVGVTGSGTQQVLRTIPDRPKHKGTRISVLMPKGRHTTTIEASEVISKSYLPGVKFHLVQDEGIGEPVLNTMKADMEGKSTLSECTGRLPVYVDFDGNPLRGPDGAYLEDANKVWQIATAFVNRNKSAKNDVAFIRVNGLYMFESYIGEGLPGWVIVEIKAPSNKVLSDNRLAFTHFATERWVDELKEHLIVDKEAAFKQKKSKNKVYRGTGKFTSQDQQAEVLGLARVSSSGEIHNMPEIFKALEEKAKAAEQRETTPEGQAAKRVGAPASAKTNAAIVNSVEVIDTKSAENVLKHVAWTPDFFNQVQDEEEGMEKYDPPDSLKPITMSLHGMRLAKVWAAIIKLILATLGATFRPYGIGFIFSTKFGGMYHYIGFLSETPGSEGEWILLNPYRDVDTRKHLLDPTEASDLREIYSIAIHECTHMVDGVSDHNIAFARAITSNIAKTAHLWGKVEQVAKTIKLKAGTEVTEDIDSATEFKHKAFKAPKKGKKGEKSGWTIEQFRAYINKQFKLYLAERVFSDDMPIEERLERADMRVTDDSWEQKIDALVKMTDKMSLSALTQFGDELMLAYGGKLDHDDVGNMKTTVARLLIDILEYKLDKPDTGIPPSGSPAVDFIRSIYYEIVIDHEITYPRPTNQLAREQAHSIVMSRCTDAILNRIDNYLIGSGTVAWEQSRRWMKQMYRNLGNKIEDADVDRYTTPGMPNLVPELRTYLLTDMDEGRWSPLKEPLPK